MNEQPIVCVATTTKNEKLWEQLSDTDSLSWHHCVTNCKRVSVAENNSYIDTHKDDGQSQRKNKSGTQIVMWRRQKKNVEIQYKRIKYNLTQNSNTHTTHTAELTERGNKNKWKGE